MRLSPKIQKDIWVIAALVLLGTSVGIILASAISRQFSQPSVVVGTFVGFIISFLCAVGNFGFLPRFERLPFLWFILIKSMYFTAVTVLVVAARFVLLRSYLNPGPLTVRLLVIVVFTTLVFAFVVNLIFMLRRMLGQNVLYNFFSGRYHKPLEEQRIFMFLDIVSSTTIAEQIGHVKFHMLLNDFFFEISDPILMRKGEIYKYVGDEVIVSWEISKGIEKANCVRVFFEINQYIERNRGIYEKKYGFVPRYRAGIHGGKVIVGEMGDFKREIAFLGDTVNTTARIQEATKKYGKDLIVSSTVIEKLSLPADLKAEKLGVIRLRGKEQEIELYSVALLKNP